MYMKKIKIGQLLKVLAAILLMGTAFGLLESDFFTFMTWWEILWIMGLVFMPVTARIFHGFDDKGWMWLCRMDFDFFEINSFYNIELYCNNSFVWSDQYCI